MEIRAGSLAVFLTVDLLRKEHQEYPFPQDVIGVIVTEKDRSGLTFPDPTVDYSSICWDCYRRGTRTEVDKRVDPECHLCAWAICPVCFACKDPKYGDCPQNARRAGRA
jgi:hypothetical protein